MKRSKVEPLGTKAKGSGDAEEEMLTVGKDPSITGGELVI